MEPKARGENKQGRPPDSDCFKLLPPLAFGSTGKFLKRVWEKLFSKSFSQIVSARGEGEG
jgi:hypothetical protein